MKVCGPGDLANKVMELKALDTEKSKLQSQVQSLEREANKLHKKLSAAPKVGCFVMDGFW